MLPLCTERNYPPQLMLGHKFVNSSAMIDGKLPRFKVSTKYNHTDFSNEDYDALNGHSENTDSTDRKDRICVHLPKFPPNSTPSKGSSLPRSNDSPRFESAQTVMSIFQAPLSLDNANKSVFERTSIEGHNHHQTDPRGHFSLSSVKTKFELGYQNNSKIPPDINVFPMAEEEDELRRRHSKIERKEQQQKQQSPQIFSSESNRTSEKRVQVTENCPNDKRSETFGTTGKLSNDSAFVDQSERISRLDDLVAELSTKMLQLRGGSSCVMSNLERTMQLLTQVKASLDTVYRSRVDWTRVDGCVDSNDRTLDSERGTHKSSSTTVSDISQDSTESLHPSKKVHKSQVAVETQKLPTPNPSRSKSQQWDPTVFSSNEQVERYLTTSQSTYEVSRHLAAGKSSLSPRPMLISSTNHSIVDGSGLASPSPKQKPIRRSALKLAAAIFRTSSRNRNNSPNSSIQGTSSSAGTGKFFKRRSLSKESTALKSAGANS